MSFIIQFWDTFPLFYYSLSFHIFSFSSFFFYHKKKFLRILWWMYIWWKCLFHVDFFRVRSQSRIYWRIELPNEVRVSTVKGVSVPLDSTVDYLLHSNESAVHSKIGVSLCYNMKKKFRCPKSVWYQKPLLFSDCLQTTNVLCTRKFYTLEC